MNSEEQVLEAPILQLGFVCTTCGNIEIVEPNELAMCSVCFSFNWRRVFVRNSVDCSSDAFEEGAGNIVLPCI